MYSLFIECLPESVSGAASLRVPFRGVQVLGAATGRPFAAALRAEFVPLLVMSRANSSADVLFLRKGFGLDTSSANCLVKEFSLSSE